MSEQREPLTALEWLRVTHAGTLSGRRIEEAIAAALAAERAVAAREAAAVKAAVAGLAEPADPNARMDAYYYGFERTGIGIIDGILSAVAQAGKSYHSTEGWADDAFGAGSPEGWIQAAADAAATRLRAVLSEALPGGEK